MSFTRLRYHIVFATKERARWIWPEVEAFLYPVIGHIARQLDGRLLAVGGVQDHVHLVCAIRPSIALDDFVRDVKSRSSAAVRGEFENLYGFGWQDGYGGFTLNPLDMDEIFAYVRNQKEHHANNELHDLWERVTGGSLVG